MTNERPVARFHHQLALTELAFRHSKWPNQCKELPTSFLGVEEFSNRPTKEQLASLALTWRKWPTNWTTLLTCSRFLLLVRTSHALQPFMMVQKSRYWRTLTNEWPLVAVFRLLLAQWIVCVNNSRCKKSSLLPGVAS